jgi:hypothetical protein
VSELAQTSRPFFELYLAGLVKGDQMDDFVAAWHEAPENEDRPLAAFLGMTEDEYAVWVMDPAALPMLRTARRATVPFRTSISNYVAALRGASKAADEATILALSNWLENTQRA